MLEGIKGSSGTSVKSIRLKFCTPKIINYAFFYINFINIKLIQLFWLIIIFFLNTTKVILHKVSFIPYIVFNMCFMF